MNKTYLCENGRQTSIALVFTSNGRHESFNSTGHGSQGEIAHHRCIKGDCESKDNHDQPSNSQVDQDEVEWLPELLVLRRDQQCQKVDWEASADQEKHPEGQQLKHPRICQIVLRIFKRISNKTRPVVHWDIEVLALRAVLHLSKLEPQLAEKKQLATQKATEGPACDMRCSSYDYIAPKGRLTVDEDDKQRGSA